MSTLDRTAGTERTAAPHGARRRQPHVILNPITILGACVALLGLGGAGFALVAGFLDEDPSTIKGILGYVVMPNIALGGLVLMIAGVLWGAWHGARAAAAVGEPASVRIDLNGWRHLFGIAAFLAIAVGSLTVLGGTTYRAIEFTESTTFCGTCHTVMQPQVESHVTSPHAEVECTKCHIAYRASPLGPNAKAYIDSKIGGLRQTYSVITGSYDHPVRAPADAIPATNTTCEGCHAPDKDYGVVLRQYQEYASDEKNTRHTRVLAFPVGSDGKDDDAHAIHWHATAKLYYVATDESRTAISWAGVETPGGMEEWTNPTEGLAEGATDRQLMSCIDCHNRAGHKIPTPDELVDDALERGRMDRTLPYIKRETVALLGGTGEGANPKLLAAQFAQPGWFDRLATFYRDNYPEVAVSKEAAIQNAIDEMKKISKQILYPDMEADWLTYPDNLSHRLPTGLGSASGQQTPGCFRCHGTLVNKTTGERLAGTMGGEGCLSCHGVTSNGETKIGPTDPTKTETCSLCHVTADMAQLGGAPANGSTGETSALPMDSLHQQR